MQNQTSKVPFSLLFIGLLFAAGIDEARGENPPLGKRKYLIEGDIHKPVVITEKTKEVTGSYLQDPNFFTGQDIKAGKTIDNPKAKPPSPNYIPTRLSFKKMNIRGEIINPRVYFEKPTINIDRADEPIPEDFLFKVFEDQMKPDPR